MRNIIKMPYKDKEKQKQHAKEYYQKNKEKKLQYNKEWRLKNKEYHKLYSSNYYYFNKLEINKKTIIRQAKRYKTDTNYKITRILRKRLYYAVKNKKFKTMELLGCDVKKLWQHLESKFQPGMTRENHGLWHVDHIIPCASFDLRCPVQQLACFHYTNLQPLWAIDNLKKGAKYD